MPSIEELEQSTDGLLRVLAMGKQKSKKTWWACAAAEANFNVLLLDGDDGWTIAKKLSPAAKKRVQVISLKEATKQAIFAPFITRILKQGRIIWDLEERKNAGLQPNENCVSIDLLSRTNADILILDSWTALCWSLQFQFALENKIDLSDAEKVEWEFYGWGGRLATWFINQLKTLPLHVIIVGHKTVYEKIDKKTKETIFTKEQLISTSNPHSMTIGNAFTDILSFRQLSDSVFKIDVSSNESKEGGSRSIKPGTYDWEKLTFAYLCKQSGIPLPTENNPLWDINIGDISTINKSTQSKPLITDNKTKLSINIKR